MCCCEDHGRKLWKVRAKAEGRPRHDPWTDKRREAYHRRRALKKGASTGNPVLFSEIAERDGWRCHLCGDRVKRGLAWPHPQSASLDHVIPLSRGGLHDPVNVRLAHLVCNVAKGNRGAGEQLLLIG
jgi:5-methylcytosine-specific restriction endonuclease McrA